MNRCTILLIIISLYCISCKYKFKPNTSNNEIEKLIAKSIKVRDTLINTKGGDSLLSVALSKSIITDQPKSNAEICIAMLRYYSAEKLNDKNGKQLFDSAIKNAIKIRNKNLEEQSYFAYCEYLLKTNNPSKAMLYYNLISTNPENHKSEIEKKILLSSINDKQEFPAEQLRNLLSAHYLSVDVENDSLQLKTLRLLSDYYYYQKKYDKALEYNSKVKDLIRKKMPKDSTAWYYAEENRLFLFIQSSEDISMTGLAKKIIRYANSTHNLQLSSNVQSSLRTYFFNHHDLANLQLWYKQFPEELQVLKTTNPSFYYRTKAYLNEYDNKIDSAKINWKLGGYNENANSHLNFMYYKRLGEFEERIGDSTQAEGSFEKALSFALQNNSYINQIAMSEKIAKYYQKKGNIDLSLKNLQIANQSKSNWIKTLSDDNIKNIELSNILAQNELEHDKSQEALERKHFTQYLIISLFILLLIMIMIGVSFYNIPSWWIKSMGYISFLMFFESIILLVDHKLHELTNGSPIIILVVKMIILSFMFPTHHWIEQRFVTILLKGDIKRRVHWFFSLFKKKKNISLSE